MGSIFQPETMRLLWLIGFTFALILAFQYLELPYGNVLLSLFSTGKIPTSGSSIFQATDPLPEAEIVNNMTNFNQANSTSEHALEIANKTRMLGEKDTFPRTGFVLEPGSQPNKSLGFYECDKSSMLDPTKRSGNASATQLAGDLGPSGYNNTTDLILLTNCSGEENITSRSEHKSGSPYANSPSPSHGKAPTYSTPPLNPETRVSPNITTAASLNDYNISLSQKDNKTNSMRKSFRPSQNDGDALGKNSSINSVPMENQDSHTPVPEVTSISKMNKLLPESHASYRSMIPRWSSAVDHVLLQARSEIENAPIVKNDPNLYAPFIKMFPCSRVII